MKEKVSTINIPIYDQRLRVIVTSSVISSRVKRNKTLGEPVTNLLNAKALFSCNDFEYFLFVKKGYGMDSIMHELFHATVGILEDVGTKFEIDNHEPFAYLHGFICQKAAKIIKAAK